MPCKRFLGADFSRSWLVFIQRCTLSLHYNRWHVCLKNFVSIRAVVTNRVKIFLVFLVCKYPCMTHYLFRLSWNPFLTGPLINGGGQGAFSPMALPPNTMLVPADDPSNPGQPLFRLMQLDQNGGPPGPQGPGMGMPNMPGMQQPQQPFYPPEVNPAAVLCLLCLLVWAPCFCANVISFDHDSFL